MDNWFVANVGFTLDGKETGFHLRVNPTFVIHRRMIASFRRKTMYAPFVSDFLFTILHPGDRVIDVGAHMGYFSLLASILVGDQGFVWSFEPEYRNFVQLQVNVRLNRRPNVQSLQQALGATVKDTEFFVNTGRQDGIHSLFQPTDPQTLRETKPETVTVLPLDQAMGKSSQRYRLLMVDVNGAETDVLKGAAALLERHAFDFIVCGVDTVLLRRMQSSEQELRALLASFGYQAYGLTSEITLVPIPDDEPLAPPGQDVILTLVFARPATLDKADGDQSLTFERSGHG